MNPGMVVRSLSRSDLLCVLGMIGCGLAGFAPVTKYFDGWVLVLFAVAIAVCVSALMLWLRGRHLSGGELRAGWLVLPWCVFVLLFIVLFPLANGHTLGAGSDRADALRIAASALVHGHYPYRALTYLGHPITPLPGAVLLAIPFFLLGNVSLQNLLWLALFLLFSQWFFRRRSTAIISVLLLLGASAARLDDFVVGGDFLVNAMYVCAAAALVMAAHQGDRTVWMRIAAGVFLGLAIDSRPVYIVVVPLLVAYVLQRRGRNDAFRLLLTSGGVAALLSVPFYLYDPAHFSPLHIRDKLDLFPAWLHADWILAALGLLTSSAGFFVRLTHKRVFLLTGASLLVMFGPPAVMGWSADGFTMWSWFDLSLTSLPALFFSLWILAKYEDTGLSLRSQIEWPAARVAAST